MTRIFCYYLGSRRWAASLRRWSLPIAHARARVAFGGIGTFRSAKPLFERDLACTRDREGRPQLAISFYGNRLVFV